MRHNRTITSSAPVTVGWYLDPIEAEIARGLLESAGIPAFLHSKEHSQIDWPVTLALGGIRLQVPPSAAADATAILDSVSSVPESKNEPSCPKCGSRDVISQNRSWCIAFLVVHALKIPLPFKSPQKKCRDCGADCGT
ncbi:DUF2007 domain-containing protein [Halomonas halocynthiae]|uniref:putative signal transducing protein n=1 Tax=Halomonas halocynthiae TaxID=176290 RepID=UPI000A02F211|nr:DUF2007 domain-containing protein [Halomonas halocynthiae]